MPVMKEPNVPPRQSKPSGYSPTEVERELLLAYDYCQLAVDHATLTHTVLQALFTTGVVGYFSVMKQSQHRQLRGLVLDVLGGRNDAHLGIEIVLRYHQGPPSDLVDTYEFFETLRDKSIAHKDPNRNKYFSTERQPRWVRVPSLGSSLKKHPLYHRDNESSYFGLGASYAKEQTKRAMVDLISVTLQILWQRPEVLPMHSNGDAK